jgi:hypothetical protein
MIGPQIPVPGSADDLTRLLALFGRTAQRKQPGRE